MSLDWVGNRRRSVFAWGIPTTAMIIAIWLPADAKLPIWVVSLIWMGSACLINARHCGRTHCHFTGPFFLIMSVAVLLHGLAVVPLGGDGWTWLGVTIAVGTGGLWLLTEKVWGKFLSRAPNAGESS